MKKIDAQKEMDYQLIKLLLFNLERAGLITFEESEIIRKQAQTEINPIIGCLD